MDYYARRGAGLMKAEFVLDSLKNIPCFFFRHIGHSLPNHVLPHARLVARRGFERLPVTRDQGAPIGSLYLVGRKPFLTACA
ncbi:protein of unknown function [Pseudomonas sp. JV551A1]|uniref:Uncharacterized protein n=1 Tax=Pseudomonas inefficax TaxID=2078786 RepID=A0AAQ1PAG1_9PSED|nr:protein of unknown function [Pseudomonas sp. JV551A1]SPO62241.1 protein of unknown function [Pseudomonas inefficax]